MAEPPDDLARTATAAAGAGGAAPALGATLGRYRLERLLGEGGMGVVHAAFDPDLERRVALKVLRTADGGDLARQRLLREARAMARLTHPNVVTVHEVGSADGRDYVAMELVDGESLDEWLRAGKRTSDEIVDAFAAAGRGLAAAHAAGLVHRDFKPHNVLRRRDGRIAVTDFGLARGVEVPAALARTIDLKAATPAITPGTLAELTVTGSLLGTPAYMAPEQWTGGTVGPAADQFAFCVAAWEALTGARPFRGATLDQLKAEVQRGPARLDASKLPRRLRAALRRGLDPDPGRRWPSIDALLAAIRPRDRRRPIALFAGAGAVVVAAGIYAVVGTGAPAAACAPPALDPAVVWPASEAAALRATGRGLIADAFDRDLAAWTAARGRACAAPTAERVARLACLDGVLARLDALHRAAGRVEGRLAPDDVIAQMVEPGVCEVAAPPRLVVTPSPDVIAAFADLLDASRDDTKLAAATVGELVHKQGLDPCARTIAQAAIADLTDKDVAATRAAHGDAIAAAEACGDDRLLADALVDEAPLEYELPMIGPRGEAAVKKAATAVGRVAQPDLRADIELMRTEVATLQGRWDDAFATAERAIDDYGKRHRRRAQVKAALLEIRMREQRANLVDLTVARKLVATWKPVADEIHEPKLARSLARTDAACRWFLGDTEAAQRDMMRLWEPASLGDMPRQRVEGTVTEPDGKPAAGVQVIAGQLLFVDAHGPFPIREVAFTMRMATTDASGAFAIPDAVAGSIVVAVGGKQRSLPQNAAPHVKLALAPVRRITGTADLGGRDRTTSFVIVQVAGFSSYKLIAPIGEGGAFAIDGAPIGKVQIGIATRDGLGLGSLVMTSLADAGATSGVHLALTSSERTLDLIARSSTAQPLDSAQVVVFSGHLAFKSVGEILSKIGTSAIQVQFARPLVGEAVPHVLIDKLRPGDLVAQFQRVAAGELTACAIGFNGDFRDTKFATTLQSHASDLAFKCVWVGAGDGIGVVEAPPQKRYD